MTQQGLYKLFGLREVKNLPELDNWLNHLPNLSDDEILIANFYRNRLVKNISSWNEQELSLGFIGPVINIIDYKVPYQLNFFAQRPLSGVIGDYEMIGKPDGMLAAGNFEPEAPFFAFQVPIAIGNKKDVNSSGDPAGQNLAAMLVGQAQNSTDDVIYGCYIVGRLWYFMVLKRKEFAISQEYLATKENGILEIVKVLKALRTISFKRLNIDPNMVD